MARRALFTPHLARGSGKLIAMHKKNSLGKLRLQSGNCS